MPYCACAFLLLKRWMVLMRFHPFFLKLKIGKNNNNRITKLDIFKENNMRSIKKGKTTKFKKKN